MPLMDYPKTITLKSGDNVVLRPMRPEDEQALLDFFQRVPAEERLFFKDNVTNPAVIRKWAKSLDFERIIPLLALSDGTIVGDATLHRRKTGWSTHVGEIRVVIDKDWRGKGLGSVLAQELFHLALSLKVEKVMAQMMSDQPKAEKVFAKLGFTKEATLRDHVLDRKGNKHDLIIMCQDVEVFWKRMEDVIAESHRDFSGHE